MNFTDFYQNTHRKIFLYLYLRVVEKHYVDDLVQDTYIRFYQKLNTESFEGADVKILFGFAKNILREFYTKQGKVRDVEYFEDFDYSTVIDFVAEENIGFSAEQVRDLFGGIEQLKGKVKEVIKYRFLQGFTRKEVAETLDIKERDVLKYQQRGIKYLKKIIVRVGEVM